MDLTKVDQTKLIYEPKLLDSKVKLNDKLVEANKIVDDLEKKRKEEVDKQNKPFL